MSKFIVCILSISIISSSFMLTNNAAYGYVENKEINITINDVIEIHNVEELENAINTAKDGDLIKIYPGAYEINSLEINNNSQIIIQGCDKDGNPVKDANNGPYIYGEINIKNQDNLNISGLKARNLNINNSSNINIKDCIINNYLKLNGSVNDTVIESTKANENVMISGVTNVLFKDFYGYSVNVGVSQAIKFDSSKVSNLYLGTTSYGTGTKNTIIENSTIYALKMGYDGRAEDTNINSSIIGEVYVGYDKGEVKNTILENSQINNGVSIGYKGISEDTIIRNCSIKGKLNIGTYSGIARNTYIDFNEYEIGSNSEHKGIFLGNSGGIAEQTTIVSTEDDVRINGGVNLDVANDTLIIGDNINYRKTDNTSKLIKLSEFKEPADSLNGIGYKGARIEVTSEEKVFLDEELKEDGQFTLDLNSPINDNSSVYINIFDIDGNVLNKAELIADVRLAIPISTKEELNAIRDNLYKDYYLTKDIVFAESDFKEGGAFYNNGLGWNPIGNIDKTFKGSFDGKGYEIKGLNVSNTEYAGLFGYNEGKIKNLGIVNGSFKAESNSKAYAGGVSAYNKGIIENCYNSSTISAKATGGMAYDYAGGIAGNNFGGSIYNSYNTGKIITESSSYWTYIGGIAGDNRGNITGCYNIGDIEAKKITKSSSAYIYVGGISGGNYSGGTINKSYNKGEIKGDCETINYPEVKAGGIAGSNISTIGNSYNIGNIEASSKGEMKRAYTGGIAGSNRIKIYNCYTLGSIKNNGQNITDRIAGHLEYDSSNSIESSYCISENLSIEDFLNKETYKGFDFDNIWTMDGNEDYLYPELQGVNMIFEKAFTDIEIANLPEKLTYAEGEEFDSKGLVVMAKYNNGFKEEIEDYEINGYDSNIGTKTITITCKDKIAQFEVKVNPKMQVINSIPKITAEDIHIKEGDEFDPLVNVSAYDEEDGDLTHNIEILNNNVDTENEGDYTVTYKVQDSQGASVTKNISVIVRSNNKPEIVNVYDQIIEHNSEFDPMENVSAYDNEDGNINDKIQVEGFVDTQNPGGYKLIYSVTDSDGNKAEVECLITVKEAPNKVPTISANDKTIDFGDEFNPLDGITANDEEDGDLTDKIEVIYNDVNIMIAGTYKVEYSVVDSKGSSSIKTVYITVKESLSGWQEKDGKWYYYNSEGLKQKGWLDLKGTWYYLRNDGEMATGWERVGSKWYYLNDSGIMQKGWLDLKGTWYYLRNDGEMATGWERVGSKWYYLNDSGIMQKGWLDLKGTWYYLKSNGEMVNGWEKVGSKWYYFNNSGVMQKDWLNLSGTWYYLRSNGEMATGWEKVGGNWYYLYESGKMATNTTIDGWRIDSNGVGTPIR